MFPNPDMKTHNRLMAAAQSGGQKVVGPLSSEIMSAVVCFLIGSVGPEKTSEILREWATGIMRRKLVKENISND